MKYIKVVFALGDEEQEYRKNGILKVINMWAVGEFSQVEEFDDEEAGKDSGISSSSGLFSFLLFLQREISGCVA